LFLLLIPLLFCAGASASLDVNVSNWELKGGELNKFYWTIACNDNSDYLKQGDLVQFYFFACANNYCTQAYKENFVFKPFCTKNGSFDFFVPQMANDKIVETIQIAFIAKRFEETNFTLKQLFNFGGAFQSEPFLSFPTITIPPTPNFSSYYFGTGIALIVLSILLIYLRRWYALLPFLAGFALITWALFG
jgi:hypothetical protein